MRARFLAVAAYMGFIWSTASYAQNQNPFTTPGAAPSADNYGDGCWSIADKRLQEECNQRQGKPRPAVAQKAPQPTSPRDARIAKNKEDLAALLEKGKHERLMGSDQQLLSNLWFNYESDARMPQFWHEGEPKPTPVRSGQLEKDYEEVKRIQQEFAKNSQEAGRAAAQQEASNSSFSVYLTVYFAAKKCSDSDFVFSREIVNNIATVVKDRGKAVSKEIKDKQWQVLQKYYNSIVVSEQDCSQAMKQAHYMLPQDVFSLKDAPKNPF